MIVRNVNKEAHPRLVAWMRDAERTDPFLDVRLWVGHDNHTLVVTRIDGINLTDEEYAKVLALFETPPPVGDVNRDGPPPVAGRRVTCLNEFHSSGCRCGSKGPNPPTLDDVAKLHARTVTSEPWAEVKRQAEVLRVEAEELTFHAHRLGLIDDEGNPTS